MKDLLLFAIAFILGITLTACTSENSEAKNKEPSSYRIDALVLELEETKAAYNNLMEVLAKEREDREQNAAIRFDKITRGFKNKNPMNVMARGSKDPWYGQIGKDKEGYAIFETYQHGIRAGYITLRHYAIKHKINTIAQLAKRYCPDDHIKYTKFLSGKLGIKPNAKIDLLDHMQELLMCIIEMENGYNPFPAEWFVAYKR